MRTIDMQTWSRRKHFELYSAFDHPHFGMCANVDLTRFYPLLKQRGYSLTVAITYVLSRAANAIPEFRQRIQSGGVLEHEIVHPSITVLTDEDLFSFCTMDYSEDFSEFAARATEKIAYVKAHPTLKDVTGQDDLLFMTAIPWVSFTSFTHPMHLQPADSVPRFAWGKFFEDGKRLKMPLDVQGHHALMDGIHMGRFYTVVQDCLDHPEFVIGMA
jgi:chloramphenicol O-acetyltransferase type A